MPPACLTVLAPIRPGEEESLRAVLRAIGDDINATRRAAAASARPHIDFPASTRIHFARLAIFDDPDRGPGRQRLLYASVYDGDLDSHLAELVSITSDMQAIWGGCDGFTSVREFGSFIRRQATEPAAYYVSFRDDTVASIHRAIENRRRVGSEGSGGALRSGETGPGLLARVIRAVPLLADVVGAIRRYGFMNVYRSTLRILASLDRIPFFRFVNWITGNRLPAPLSMYTSAPVDHCAPATLAPGDEYPVSASPTSPNFREDVVTQNQLTLVTVITPANVDRVRAVMSAIDSYAKRLAPPGSLIGISTIHFVRWLVIDEGRRLMMVSDYDGSWENYIDEFAEMILSGLDAIWETSFGYPKDGARDLPAFKRFLRTHQVPPDVFFSAYPEETVLNIRADTALAAANGRS
jgi:hypothetical protein